MSPKIIAVIFIAKLLLLLLLAQSASYLLPYQGNFAYRPLLESYKMLSPVTALASFDGAHYIKIASEGYHQFDQVFFPFYPSLIKYLSPLFSGNQLLSGLIISNVFGLLGIILFSKWLSKQFDKNTAVWTVIFYFAFPTSFFFHTVYSESLFLFLIATFLIFATNKNYLAAGVVGFLAPLTRLVGVFNILLLPLLLKKKWFSRRGAILSGAVLSGLFVYMFYLQKTIGDAFSFFNSQAALGLNRSTDLILLPQVYFRYLKIILLSDHTYQYFVALFELIIFSLMGFLSFLFFQQGRREKNTAKITLSIFSFAHLLLPTLTGTLLSTPRFALFSFASFLFLATIKQNKVKYVILTIFILLQLVAGLFFVQGYFIS